MPTHMRRVSNLVGVEEAFLARAVRGRIPTRPEEQRASLALPRRFFAALALHDLLHGVQHASIFFSHCIKIGFRIFFRS